MKGKCSVCRKQYQLRNDGAIRKHKVPCMGTDQSVEYSNGTEYGYCYGSDENPYKPYYCDTCFLDDCWYCVDAACDCTHYCPTQLQVEAYLVTCHECGNRVEVDGINRMRRHTEDPTAATYATACSGSYLATKKVV